MTLNPYLDDGNGIYDVPTPADLERWDNAARLQADRERRANASAQELADPDWDVPF